MVLYKLHLADLSSGIHLVAAHAAHFPHAVGGRDGGVVLGSVGPATLKIHNKATLSRLVETRGVDIYGV